MGFIYNIKFTGNLPKTYFSTSAQVWLFTGYLLVNLDFLKVLAHFPGNLFFLPEMKPRNNIVY